MPVRSNAGWLWSLGMHLLALFLFAQFWVTTPAGPVPIDLSLVFRDGSELIEESVVHAAPAPLEFEDSEDHDQADGGLSAQEPENTSVEYGDAAVVDGNLSGLDAGTSTTEGQSFGDAGDGEGGQGAVHDRIMYLLDMRYHTRSPCYYLYEQECKQRGIEPTIADFHGNRGRLIRSELTDQGFAFKHFDRLVSKTANEYDLVSYRAVFLDSRVGDRLVYPISWMKFNTPQERKFLESLWFVFRLDLPSQNLRRQLSHALIMELDIDAEQNLGPTRFCMLTNGESCHYSRRPFNPDWVSRFRQVALAIDAKIDVVYLSSPRRGVQADWHVIAREMLQDLASDTGGNFSEIGYRD